MCASYSSAATAVSRNTTATDHPSTTGAAASIAIVASNRYCTHRCRRSTDSTTG